MRKRVINIETGKARMLSAKLADDKAYMAKQGLELAEVKKPKEAAKKDAPKPKEVKAPVKKTTKAKTKK